MKHSTDTPATFTAVPGYPRLSRRDGGTYYFRAKIPAPLRPIFNHAEVKFSLRTKDFKEALKKL